MEHNATSQPNAFGWLQDASVTHTFISSGIAACSRSPTPSPQGVAYIGAQDEPAQAQDAHVSTFMILLTRTLCIFTSILRALDLRMRRKRDSTGEAHLGLHMMGSQSRNFKCRVSVLK
eukprot:761997-Amphidinium_carterae.1